MPRIPNEVIERLKQEVSLERLAEAPRHQAQAPRASRRSIQLLLHGGLDQTLHQVKAVGHLFSSVALRHILLPHNTVPRILVRHLEQAFAEDLSFANWIVTTPSADLYSRSDCTSLQREILQMTPVLAMPPMMPLRNRDKLRQPNCSPRPPSVCRLSPRWHGFFQSTKV
jgi:hypothetical protein